MSDELDMSKVCLCEDFANPNCKVCFPPVAGAPLIVKHGLTEKWWIIQRDNGASDPIGPFDTKEEAEAKARPVQKIDISTERVENPPEFIHEDGVDEPTRLLAEVMHLWVDGYISKSPDSCADASISSNVFEKISQFLEAAGIEVDYSGWRRVSRPKEGEAKHV